MMSLVPTSAELPQLREIAALCAASERLWSAVADLLDAIDRALGSEGRGAVQDPISIVDARAVLEEGSAALPPGNWQSCLAAGYAKMNDCANAIDARRTGGVLRFELSQEALDDLLVKPKDVGWAGWTDLRHLWTKVAYLGGTHRSGGLAARLMTRPLFTDRRKAPRSTPPYYRWDRRDIAELRELARAVGLLATSVAG